MYSSYLWWIHIQFDYEYDDEYMFILNNMYQIMNMFIKSMIMIIHLEWYHSKEWKQDDHWLAHSFFEWHHSKDDYTFEWSFILDDHSKWFILNHSKWMIIQEVDHLNTWVDPKSLAAKHQRSLFAQGMIIPDDFCLFC